jgi:hypothetical protein
LAGQLNFFASNSSVRPVSGTEVRSVCYGNPSDSAAGYLSSDEVTGMYDDYWGAAGVRARHGADDALRFFQATPTNEDLDQLAVDIATACERWLSARGFSGEAHDDGPDVGEDDAQGLLQLASLMGMAATGERAGKKVRKTQRLGGRELPLGPRCAACEGYELVGRTRCERVVFGERSQWLGEALPLPPAPGRLGRDRFAHRGAGAGAPGEAAERAVAGRVPACIE